MEIKEAAKKVRAAKETIELEDCFVCYDKRTDKVVTIPKD